MEEVSKEKVLSAAEEMAQKELDEATSKSLSLLQTNCNFETQIEEKRKTIKDSEANVNILVEKRHKIEADIFQEKKRLFVLSKIKEYFEKVSFLQQSFTKRDYQNILDSLKEIEAMSKNLKQEESFENIKTDSLQKMRLLFDDIVSLKEQSVTFPDKQKFNIFHEILNFLHDETFENHIFSFIINNFLPKMSTKNCYVKDSSLSATPCISLAFRSDPHTPATFINESSNLLTLLLKNIEEGGFVVKQELIEKYAMAALEIGMALCGGREKETAEAAKNLCRLAKIEDIDIAKLAQESRVPKLLDDCRTMFKEGKVFGDAVSKMKDVFEGTPETGILTKITILALIEWKNDPERLRMMFTVLVAVNTDEALKCILMVQRRLDELNKK